METEAGDFIESGDVTIDKKNVHTKWLSAFRDPVAGVRATNAVCYNFSCEKEPNLTFNLSTSINYVLLVRVVLAFQNACHVECWSRQPSSEHTFHTPVPYPVDLPG
jgi:hypothetical protein